MNENAKTYFLAGAGGLQGIYRYYIRPELSAKRAWVGIGLLVAAYELLAPEGELLSQGVDRALDKHPVLTTTVIGATALHLVNLLPERLDVLHQLTNLKTNNRH